MTGLQQRFSTIDWIDRMREESSRSCLFGVTKGKTRILRRQISAVIVCSVQLKRTKHDARRIDSAGEPLK
ncbi:MAG: hypothetical protein ONB48_19415 [candidate division KSB1 bacterium]|nr:hypothetical protein [candidate division KSB1 bacterium]MDZ7287815.1 hypothetical protein [candidate division KSB1 bacterium]MDZ7296739.1 hypothetical protein [candidate division KSB1 bacterium]MDZ7347605.1 hypothetical protein [candidate division KSB1 bacterium]MDZ7351910.1 hypothetical protein [candidate division KSB1 bacterium]